MLNVNKVNALSLYIYITDELALSLVGAAVTVDFTFVHDAVKYKALACCPPNRGTIFAHYFFTPLPSDQFLY